MESATNKAITVKVDVNAPIQVVWDTWTSPDTIRVWNHASDDWDCPAALNDLKVSGAFSYTMAAVDGSASFDFGGTYTEVNALKSISYLMADGRRASIAFEQLENCVRVTETFDPESENTHELQRDGWQAILDNFKKCAESKVTNKE
jgi:uncharacterized protein YndB with AHSA1/START domain